MIGKNITIIGGSGGMGIVFARLFRSANFRVTITARNEEKLKIVAEDLNVNFVLDLKKSVSNADLVMISIPIHSTADMIEKIAPFLKPDALIFDITSLKENVFKSYIKILKEFSINCVSLHPMFGPGINNMKNYVIIFLRIGGTEDYNKKIDELMEIFSNKGLILQELQDPVYHDKMMALVLGVPHMFNILFLDLMRQTGEPLSDMTQFTGTTFLLQKVFAESIIQREVEMFGEIQIYNDEFLPILSKFENIVHEYKKIIKKGDLNKFKQIFKNGLEYCKSDEHFEKSYEYFYEMMKILKENKS